MAHDPRAPRLAAASTLLAGGLLIASALNLQLNIVGQVGISSEEMIAVIMSAIAIIVARFANQEREIPDLVQSPTGYATTDSHSSQTAGDTQETSVNPTTASILTSILGERATSTAGEVESAISTLSAGEFGADVQRTIEAVQPPSSASEPNLREATPADDNSGQTLERVLVQPVPLPGRENDPVVDPSTIPGLSPNRAFVREGVASVPLPGQDGLQTSPAARVDTPSITTPQLPEVLDLPDLVTGNDEPSSPKPSSQDQPQITTTVPVLPDLDDLFAETESPIKPLATVTVPELPDLDDLF